MSAKYINKIKEHHLNLYQPDKPQFEVLELGNYLKEQGEHATEAHIQSFYQVIWFRSGDGSHTVDFKEYPVSENSIFFISKNQVHYFDKYSDYTGVLINFNESFLIQQDSEIEFFLRCSLFNNPYQQPLCCIQCNMDSILNEYLRQIERELACENNFGKEELLRSYLKSFLIQIQRRRNEFEKNGEQSFFQINEKRTQLIRFINLIDENYQKGLTITEYAQLLHISTRTLSDLTNQLLGKSPSLMIQERIILEAQRMLLYSELNVNQIGYRLGFDDPSYFVKYFKKHTKVSPSEFRKSIS